MANTEENYRSQSRWIKERRYGIHGIDHMETGALDKDPVPSFDELYYDFCQTVHGLDENVGRVLNRLDKLKLTDDTLVFYLVDNGLSLLHIRRWLQHTSCMSRSSLFHKKKMFSVTVVHCMLRTAIARTLG